MTGPALSGWAVETLIASTLLMVLVLAIRSPVRRTFGPQLGYALWALPLLRLLLPPLPEAWTQATTPIARAGASIAVLIVDPGVPIAAVPVAATATGPSLAAILAAAWAIGALVFLAWHLAGHARFCRRMLAGIAGSEQVQGVQVITSAAAAGPLAFGVLNRYVAFPPDFVDRYDEDERELALAHEIGHHQRGDLVANWVALAVLALHWFNPIAWRAFRAFRADQELANDARVLAGRSAIDRHAYACAIVKAAHGGAVSAACHLHTIDDLKGRIRMLSTLPQSRRRLAFGSGAVSLLVLAGLGLTASGTSAAHALSTRVGETIGVDLQVATPVPPVPPVPPVSAGADVPTVPDAPAAPVRRVVVKRVGKDGNTSTYDSTNASAPNDRELRVLIDRSMASVPNVTERRCAIGKDGGANQIVVHSKTGDTQVMVICTNRIEAAASAGAAATIDTANLRRHALAIALSSVEASRASIGANRDMPAADRTRALAEMDAALAELREQSASPEKD